METDGFAMQNLKIIICSFSDWKEEKHPSLSTVHCPLSIKTQCVALS
jgi:hypothetical protein